MLDVHTPSNFYQYGLTLSGAAVLFHGQAVRRILGGQLPMMVLKSKNRGKGLGKSYAQRAASKMGLGDWVQDKIDWRLAIETIKKRGSYTTSIIFADDIKKDTFLVKITEMYDQGAVYETNEVSLNLTLMSRSPLYVN